MVGRERTVRLMKVTHHIAGVLGALFIGSMVGCVLFPSRAEMQAARPHSIEGSSPPVVVTALRTSKEREVAPGTVYSELLESRASASPYRAELGMRKKVRAMDDREIVALVERIVAGEITLASEEIYFLNELFARYTAFDAVAAQHTVEDLPNQAMRIAAQREVMRVWARNAPEQMVAHVARQRAAGKDIYGASISAFRALGDLDPELGIKLLEPHRGKGWSYAARGALYERWLLKDKPAAIDWMLSQVGGSVPDEQNLISWLSGDPEAALTVAADTKPNVYSRNAVEAMMGKWIKRDREPAIEALGKLPSEWYSESLAKFVGSGVTYADWSPEQLERVLAALPTKHHDGLWRGVVRSSTYSAKFEEAAGLLAKLSPGDSRSDAAAELANTWAKTNPSETSAWLSSLEPSPMRDEAVGAFAKTVAPLDSESARRWAESIESRILRKRVLRELD